MNKVTIVEASESDRRLMSGLLTRAGYEPIAVDKIEAAKDEVAKLSPGAVVVAAMKFTGGTAQELINWQKREGYKFPVIAVVDNLNPSDLLELIRSGGAVDAIQRPAIDKQLVETVDKYVKPERIVIQLDNALIPRRSAKFREIEQAIGRIAETNANCIIFGESGMGKEQIARQIYLQSSRTQKPITVIEAGGAELVGLHDPKCSEMLFDFREICNLFEVCVHLLVGYHGHHHSFCLDYRMLGIFVNELTGNLQHGDYTHLASLCTGFAYPCVAPVIVLNVIRREGFHVAESETGEAAEHECIANYLQTGSSFKSSSIMTLSSASVRN